MSPPGHALAHSSTDRAKSRSPHRRFKVGLIGRDTIPSCITWRDVENSGVRTSPVQTSGGGWCGRHSTSRTVTRRSSSASRSLLQRLRCTLRASRVATGPAEVGPPRRLVSPPPTLGSKRDQIVGKECHHGPGSAPYHPRSCTVVASPAAQDHDRRRRATPTVTPVGSLGPTRNSRPRMTSARGQVESTMPDHANSDIADERPRQEEPNPLCVKAVIGRVGRVGSTWGCRSVWLGPGVTSPKSRSVGMESRSRWLMSRSRCPPGPVQSVSGGRRRRGGGRRRC